MKIIRKLRSLLGTNRNTISSSIRLPPAEIRMGGLHFKDDYRFVATAASDVQKLVDFCGLREGSTVCDWGCGAGRLAVGLKIRYGEDLNYIGVDIQKNLIDWSKANLQDGSFKFIHLNLYNERYNPDGVAEPALGIEDKTIDVFYAYSVFSHLNADDSASYLKLIAKVLRREGKAFITGFFEEGVEDWTENPSDYGPLDWQGPLHCTRFSKVFFERQCLEAGLCVDQFIPHRETDGQSVYILQLKDSSPA